MITIKIIEKNDEENEEYTLEFPKPNLVKPSSIKYLTPEFPKKRLIEELGISANILSPYLEGEDFIFIHKSKMWEGIDLYPYDVLSQRFKEVLPNMGNSKIPIQKMWRQCSMSIISMEKKYPMPLLRRWQPLTMKTYFNR